METGVSMPCRPVIISQEAVAFIDYEYWYYSCINSGNTAPDPMAWYQELSERYNLTDIMVFGAFTQDDLKGEITKIRNITNTIITTHAESRSHSKDMTDFIMLDYIYQMAVTIDPCTTCIIFTGDGHFQSVVKYLKMKRHLDVVICGVPGNISYSLQTAASNIIEYGNRYNYDDATYFKWVTENFDYIEHNLHKNIIPTFMNTAMTVAQRHNVDVRFVQIALEKMIEFEYIYKTERLMSSDQSIRILAPNWDKLQADGLTDFQYTAGT